MGLPMRATTLLSLAVITMGTMGCGGPTADSEAPQESPTAAASVSDSLVAIADRVDTLVDGLDGGTGGVSVDNEGNIFVADFGALLSDPSTMGPHVFLVTAAGEASIFATGLEGASGNGIDSAGNLFQSNIRGNKISKITLDGTVTLFTDEGVNAPVGIEIDADDTLWVANCGTGSIQKVTSDGVSTRFVEHELLQCPNGITIDDAHNLYVANFNNGDVVKVTPDAEVSVLATLPGGNNGHLVHHEGALYVVDRGGHQVYRVDLDGEIELVAGSGTRGSTDGDAATAELSFPNDLGFSPDGSILYVNEISATTGEHTELAPMRVRRIFMHESGTS
jgi:sugar lactone lactonase YvrE